MKQTSFLSLIHGTIHHHEHSSFLTNMTMKQSFLTNGVSLFDVIIRGNPGVISKQVLDSLL